MLILSLKEENAFVSKLLFSRYFELWLFHFKILLNWWDDDQTKRQIQLDQDWAKDDLDEGEDEVKDQDNWRGWM